MNEYDITKLPFTSISRENWQMLKDLDAETLYEVIQNVSEYVLTGEKCECGNTLSKVVCNQLINVIDRKGQKSHNSSNNLPVRKKGEQPKEDQTKEEPQVSAFTESTGNSKTQQYDKVENLDDWVEFFNKMYVSKGPYEMEVKMKDVCDTYNYDFSNMRAAYYAKYPPKQKKEVAYA